MPLPQMKETAAFFVIVRRYFLLNDAPYSAGVNEAFLLDVEGPSI